MLRFAYPELFLLAIPLWFAYRRWGRAPGFTGVLRLSLLATMLVALAGPELNIGGRGLDVIVVADRSRSMPRGSQSNVQELIENLEKNRGVGDRTAVVTFGATSAVEYELSTENKLGEFAKQVMPDGSDLNEGLLLALNRVNRDRPARILVLSDGEANGRLPAFAARRAREQGVPIDYRLYERLRAGDVAVESVMLPESVSPREPFQFTVGIYASHNVSGTVRVLRDGVKIAEQTGDISAGMNRLLFRDLLEGGGFYNYSVELDVADDPVAENNRGAGVVRVDAGPKVLVLNTDGAEGNLVRALRSARIPVDIAIAKEHPLTQDALDPYRAVVIENVPADHLGRLKMERLAQFVEDLGGGLLITGGERSFGTGGYFKSPLDDVLPVSMEMREEHRKSRVALAIALDRSGSMMAPVKGNKVKMDLANLGTAECVRLLSGSDKVAVIAVDSMPHVIQELTSVENKEAIASRVLKIESMGGGIFVYEALVAAGNELMKAGDYQTRHIILFSDAADSEEPGDYKNLLAKYQAAGISVSVIGLGDKSDVDAKLLEDIGKLGGGNVMFTSDAEELPRLFTQDTMSIARSTFVKKEETQPAGIPGVMVPESRLLGELGSGAFPAIDGYNLSYLKPDATAAVISQDEYNAPWSAFWYRGLGRVAALTMEVDGQYSGQFGTWEGYSDFLITHARWLLGGDNPNQLFVDIQTEGQDAVVTVELDPQRDVRLKTQPPELIVVPPGSEREATISPTFTWTGPDTLQARFRLDREGTYRTLVKTAAREMTRGPVVTLPYSPEFAPRLGLPTGKETLQEVAKLSGGESRADVLEVFRDPPRSPRMVSLLPYLFIAAICLMLLEIAGRRLSLWQRMAAGLDADETKPQKWRDWIPKWKIRAPKIARAPRPATEQPTRKSAPAPRPQPEPVAEKPGANVYDQAKQRARRRMGK